ncbi:MAG TPA: DsbA family protein [Nitrospiria bacterium]
MPLPIKVDYYTDPLCSWCYAMEETLDQIKHFFGPRIDIRYKMFPLFEDVMEVMTPLKLWTIADRWAVVSKKTRVPIDSGLWYEDPPQSAWPPCIAYKAAEHQNKEKAETFLKLLRIAAMTQRKNISKHEIQIELVKKAGLDPIAFETRVQKEELKQEVAMDVQEAEGHGIDVRPTMIFSNAQGDRVITAGLRSFILFQHAIEALDAE